ncbi:MAG: prephenate dehydrogenase/arogenate dehydrogenase family protein [Arenicellaceae bacterium]|nr:prephenate dehydrogenase/arogenate dehydrogenase family protein [Arenicellaceae bacterium]
MSVRYQFEKMVIVGVGLIGGSLARVVRHKRIAAKVVGVTRSRESIEKALKLGVIDSGTNSLGEALPGADFVVLATPVKTLERQLGEVATLTSDDCTVTDVGSVKTNLVEAVASGFPSMLKRFVPGHPIAGKESSGVGASTVDLFEGNNVIITPIEQSSFYHIERVTCLWESVGAQVLSMTPADHDRVFAWTSHLPHAVAFALVKAMASHTEADTMFDLAAGGFYDFTRISSSDPVMWRDVSLANKEALLEAISGYKEALNELERLIVSGDSIGIERYFKQARDARNMGLEQKNGIV